VSIKNKREDQCNVIDIGNGEVGSRFGTAKQYYYEGDVYDLSVADNHSYTVNGMVVHNCMDAIWTACQGMSPCRRDAVKDEAKREKKSSAKYDWMSDF
jgi:hypothetical protein